MKCKEIGCNGNIGPETVSIQTGCDVMTPSPYCGVCGAIYSPGGERMYQRGFDNKPFFIDGEIVQKPTAEEEVRSMKVENMIALYDCYEEDGQEEVLEYLRKIVKLSHTPDCALGAVPACTCGIREAEDFLKEHE